MQSSPFILYFPFFFLSLLFPNPHQRDCGQGGLGDGGSTHALAEAESGPRQRGRLCLSSRTWTSPDPACLTGLEAELARTAVGARAELNNARPEAVELARMGARAGGGACLHG